MKELGLLLFPEALANAVRMERVLSTPGGHLLLVGSSGVGRRSLLTLVRCMPPHASAACLTPSPRPQAPGPKPTAYSPKP